MKKLSQKKIKAVSTTWKLTKRPKPEHQNSGYVSLSVDELNTIGLNDKLKLEVFDTDNKKKAGVTLTHKQVHERLVRINGARYNLLRYV